MTTLICCVPLGELQGRIPTKGEPPSTEPLGSPAATAIRTVLTQAVAATAAAAAAVGGGSGGGGGGAAVEGDDEGDWAADLTARKAGLRARLARLRQVLM